MTLAAILAGLATGLMLGIFGSGGSIITTPALLYLLQVEPKSAIAMSLGIVAIKSYAGFAGYAGAVAIDYRLMGVFTTVAIAGSLVGTHFAQRLSGDVLKRGFAVFLMLVASYILVNQVI